ncbi:uncharacterized protein TM35_000152240 [Trypanosoma theileri]|uniref:Uncharacterized protein n=1 Tax=Trypanosoma theileri TaxID=67003 RepID=A0A1X0NWD8_9TRYP|nr:uncharacterized protein TM35_000152240 [Trypanosoma theileri]ORC88793.1 hypothetical protein TM35_000152240 [Trypanosoma theileri]
MRELYTAVRQVLLFHPHTVTNYGNPSPNALQSSGSQSISMKESSELLVTNLIRVLSLGLHEGLDLWTVLETLERVPNKIAQEELSNPARKALHRLKFSGQLVYVVKSTFVRSTAAVRTRALLRLALNQGVLLAALELISRWNGEELATFYANPSISVLCSVDEELWDTFLHACAPIGGVTLADIEAGVPKGATVMKFNMKLALPDMDDHNDNHDSGHGVSAGVVDRGIGIIGGSKDSEGNGLCEKDHREESHYGDDNAKLQQQTTFDDNSDVVHVQLIPVGNRSQEGDREGCKRKKKKNKKKNANTKKNGNGGKEIVKMEEEEEQQQQQQQQQEEEVASVPLSFLVDDSNLPKDTLASVTCSDSKMNPSLQSMEFVDFKRLLDEAELLLLERWEHLSAQLSAQEALLFGQVDCL